MYFVHKIDCVYTQTFDPSFKDLIHTDKMEVVIDYVLESNEEVIDYFKEFNPGFIIKQVNKVTIEY